MQQPFPGKARQGPRCPYCHEETLLVSDHPDRFECLECGHVMGVSQDDVDFGRRDDE